MIELANFSVVREGRTICAVERFRVERGEKVAVVGPNGSGKTTLLRVLAGWMQNFQGECRVEASRSERTFVHQRPYLFRGTVLANAAYGERRRHAGQQWLERLEIGHLATRSTRNLSGGEIRRVALARALACEAKLLLLDEPLAELDPEAAGVVGRVMGELVGVAVVVSSPDPDPTTAGKIGGTGSLGARIYHLASPVVPDPANRAKVERTPLTT